jgi:hypothetical protein
MVRQVWKTEDGGIFEQEADAIEWECYRQKTFDLADHLFKLTYGVSRVSCEEIAEALLDNYNVTPKCTR